jgi:hypothetical protein
MRDGEMGKKRERRNSNTYKYEKKRKYAQLTQIQPASSLKKNPAYPL